MMTEMKALAWSAVLTWLMLVAASLLRSKGWTSPGMRIALGNRDDVPEPEPLAGRADRAARNMLENLAIFTAVVAAVQLSGKASAQTQLGATLFFWARLAYWPCYLAGIIYLRTAIWLVSMVGLAMVAAAVLP
jgi:uncharacterized MAPEG superfamily protein